MFAGGSVDGISIVRGCGHVICRHGKKGAGAVKSFNSSFEYVVVVKEVYLSKPNVVAPLNGRSRVAVCVAVCVAVVLQRVL